VQYNIQVFLEIFVESWGVGLGRGVCSASPLSGFDAVGLSVWGMGGLAVS